MAANFSRDKKGTDRALSQWEEKWQGHGPCNLQQQELPERNADQHLQPLLHGICKKQKLNFHANEALCISCINLISDLRYLNEEQTHNLTFRMSPLDLGASSQVKKKRRRRCEKSRDSSSSRQRLIAGDCSTHAAGVKTFAQAGTKEEDERANGGGSQTERGRGLHFVKPLSEISGMLITSV